MICLTVSSNLLVAVVRWFCIVLAIALFVIVVAAIVARYGFGQAVSWTEEVPRYLLIWISFLAAAVGVLQARACRLRRAVQCAAEADPRRALGVLHQRC